MKRIVLTAAAIIASAVLSYAQTEIKYSVDTLPYGSLPLGSSADYFTTGLGTGFSLTLVPSTFKRLGMDTGIDLLSLPLISADSVWVAAGSVGPSYRLSFGDRLSLYAVGKAGYYYWGGTGWQPEARNTGGFYLGGGGGALFRISGPFTVGARATYDYYSDLYNGLAAGLSLRLDFPIMGKSASTLKIDGIRFLPLFPVLYRYYDSHAVGSLQIVNEGSTAVQDISISLFVDRYMDNPTECGRPFTLGPGEQRQIELYGLFNDLLMEVTEGTKVSARLILSHPLSGDRFSRDHMGALEFYNRNALSWDDDRKIASFITAKDPEIMNFAKNIMSWMQEVKNPALDDNFQKGIAIFEAVRVYGIHYEIDPATPFSEFSASDMAIDFLQFPRQTLQYSNGDCDDLTSLYCALLESVGVETAFITVPGHIFAAFKLSSDIAEAAKTFSKTEDLVVIDDSVWLPVEITLFQEAFEKAWQTGARQWRENNASGKAVLYPTRMAWSTYQAVGFREGAEGLTLPNRDQVVASVREYTTRHIEQEIAPRLADLQAKMRVGRDKTLYLNRIAVLYARYGLYEKALEILRDIVRQSEHPDALTNLGNILFIREDYQAALGFYQRALVANKKGAAAVAGLARCNHKLENYGNVKKLYEQLKTADPALAERYAYLSTTGEEAERAAKAGSGAGNMRWEEQE